MSATIYYEVRPVDGLMELYSGVMTNFGDICQLLALLVIVIFYCLASWHIV